MALDHMRLGKGSHREAHYFNALPAVLIACSASQSGQDDSEYMLVCVPL